MSDHTFITAPREVGVDPTSQQHDDEEEEEEEKMLRRLEESRKKQEQEHDDESDRARAELEKYVSDLRARTFVQFPSEQTYTALLDVVEIEANDEQLDLTTTSTSTTSTSTPQQQRSVAGHAAGPSRWARAVLDEGEILKGFEQGLKKEKQTKQISAGLLEIRRLDMLLAQKNKEARDKDEALELSRPGSSSSSSGSLSSTKKRSHKHHHSKQSGKSPLGANVVVTMMDSVGDTSSASSSTSQQQPVFRFGLSIEQKKRLEELDRKLEELDSKMSGSNAEHEAAVTVTSGEYRERMRELDKKIEEVTSAKHKQPPNEVAEEDEKDVAEDMKELDRLCRLVAESKWEAEHPAGTAPTHPLLAKNLTATILAHQTEVVPFSFDEQGEENEATRDDEGIEVVGDTSTPPQPTQRPTTTASAKEFDMMTAAASSTASGKLPQIISSHNSSPSSSRPSTSSFYGGRPFSSSSSNNFIPSLSSNASASGSTTTTTTATPPLPSLVKSRTTTPQSTSNSRLSTSSAPSRPSNLFSR